MIYHYLEYTNIHNELRVMSIILILLYEQFKRFAQKNMRKYSNIVEGSIRRYVQSKV